MKPKEQKKIFCNQHDTLQNILERVRAISEITIHITIPRDSVIGSTDNAFQILKKEGATLKKEIIIESVDDEVLAKAARAKLKAFNPIFGIKERIVADILPRTEKEKIQIEKNVQEEKLSSELQNIPKSSFTKIIRRTSIWCGVIVGGIGMYVIVSMVLPRATITLTLKKIPVNFEEEILVDTNVSIVNVSSTPIVIPGELSHATKNLEKTFPAIGKEYVETKAKGALIVSNVFSSASQKIVAGTRFESPEGKIFRIYEALTIPGAKITNGKIIPSSITIEVVADGVGVEYNVPASKQWRIPGFKGSPKYEGFFGEAPHAMEGGFKGDRAKISEEEITRGTQVISDILRESLESQMIVLRTDRFKLLEDTTHFSLLTTDVQRDVATNTVSIFSTAEMKEFLFEEPTVQDVLVARLMQKQDMNVRVREVSIQYINPIPNFNEKKMSFIASGTLTFEPNIDQNIFRNQILDKNEIERKTIITGISGIQDATVTLWPFWVKTVPRDPSKVKIIVQ